MTRPSRLPRYSVARLRYRHPVVPYRFMLVEPTGFGRDLSPHGHERRRTRSDNQWDDRGGWSSQLAGGSATALGSVLVLGLAGYSYYWYYKSLVLRKIENAFASGYSTLELAALGRQVSSSNLLSRSDDWVPMTDQTTIDGIVDGTVQGLYHLITGEKGTGKTSMLLKAMKKIDGDGVAMMEAHGDLEIFRIRLGKALDYEFHEDYIGSLFSFKGPRDSTPLLDIERAFNKMERVALNRYKQVGKPLVLIINGAHFLRDNDDGRHLLELIQQRAELWAASNLVTIVLNSDEYWITERLMQHATRLRVIPVHDVPKIPALDALKKFRAAAFQQDVSSGVLEEVYRKIGGRLRFLTHVAKSPDMLKACDSILDKEKRWFLSQCWILGGEMDDDAEDQQEFCAAAMILAKALVEKEAAAKRDGNHDDSNLVRIPLHEARQIVTRADFIQHHDHLNIITIDSDLMVKADSVAMQNIFREICGRRGFEEHLEATRNRLEELESLRRTREVTIKDLWGTGEYRAILQNSGTGQKDTVISVRAMPSKGADA